MRKFTLEHRKKLSKAKLKNPVKYWLGKKRPELKDTKSADTMFKRGNNAWDKRKIKLSGKDHPNWKGGLPKCEKCGKELSCYSNRTNLCWDCCWENKRAISIKNKKPRDEIRYLRALTIWKEWRESIFKRDNYICQLCGNTKTYFIPHHLKGVTNFRDNMFDIDNGITVCKDCHYLIHQDKTLQSNGWYLKGGN